MSKYTHICIKPSCGKQYTNEDPDPYYCPECMKAKEQIAKEVDAKMANRQSDRKEPSFDEKMGQMRTVKGITFINLPK